MGAKEAAKEAAKEGATQVILIALHELAGPETALVHVNFA